MLYNTTIKLGKQTLPIQIEYDIEEGYTDAKAITIADVELIKIFGNEGMRWDFKLKSCEFKTTSIMMFLNDAAIEKFAREIAQWLKTSKLEDNKKEWDAIMDTEEKEYRTTQAQKTMIRIVGYHPYYN
jgi:hypothetical protein